MKRRQVLAKLVGVAAAVSTPAVVEYAVNTTPHRAYALPHLFCRCKLQMYVTIGEGWPNTVRAQCDRCGVDVQFPVS